MPLFNRMMEIYIYYVNWYSMLDLCLNQCKALWDKAVENSDVEKEMNYEEQFYRIGNMKFECFDKMSYIQKQVKLRLPDEVKRFYESTEYVDDAIFNINRGRNSK